jgi:hypothetical protein
MRFLAKALGWLLIACGTLMVAFELDQLRLGKYNDLAISAAICIIFLGGGALLVRAGRRMQGGDTEIGPAAAVPGPSLEERILAVARAHKGHVTAVEAAADGKMTVEQARTELERLTKEDACAMDIRADGLVVFRFREFEQGETTS